MKFNQLGIFLALCVTGVVLQVRTAQNPGPSGLASGIFADQSVDASGITHDENLGMQLIQAAGKDDIERVRELLRAGADVNFSNTITIDGLEDVTPLLAASYRGHVDVVRELIRRGARVDHTDEGAAPALYYAAEAGHINVVQVLLKAGASTSDVSNSGVYPLRVAVFNGHLSIVRLLVRAGADINIKDPDGDTVLMDAAMRGHTEVVRFLLAAGVDVNENNVCRGNMTALKYASQRKHVPVVRALLAAGAKVPDSLIYQMQPSMAAGGRDINGLKVFQLLMKSRVAPSIALSEARNELARVVADDTLSSNEISQKLGLLVSSNLDYYCSQLEMLYEIAQQLVEADRKLSSSSNANKGKTSQFKEKMQQQKDIRLQLLDGSRDCALDCVKRGTILPNGQVSRFWQAPNEKLREFSVALVNTHSDRLSSIHDALSRNAGFGSKVSGLVLWFAEPFSGYRHLLSLLRQKDRTIAQLRAQGLLRAAPSRSVSSQERPESNRPRKRQRIIKDYFSLQSK